MRWNGPFTDTHCSNWCPLNCNIYYGSKYLLLFYITAASLFLIRQILYDKKQWLGTVLGMNLMIRWNIPFTDTHCRNWCPFNCNIYYGSKYLLLFYITQASLFLIRQILYDKKQWLRTVLAMNLMIWWNAPFTDTRCRNWCSFNCNIYYGSRYLLLFYITLFLKSFIHVQNKRRFLLTDVCMLGINPLAAR